MKRLLLLVPFLLALIAFPANAQVTTTLATSDNATLGTILTDAKGMTVYTFKKDTPGVSNCSGTCATNWPPVTATEPLTLPVGVPGTLSLIARTDGSKQLAYNGQPLYTFAGDKATGDTKGQGVGGMWYVVNPSAAGATPVASPAASPAATPAS
jgi:predicted lipoprotein with Yx(FWY)xxD motif